jgi:hypothetical protein
MTVEAMKTVFDWSAVILLFLTFVAGAGALITGNIVSERQAGKLRQFDRDMTGTKKDLAEANARAEGFRLDIAKANESAEQARAQVAGATAEAAKANLDLAKLKAPRALTDEQASRIVAAISKFRGQEITITPYRDNPESTGIAVRIANTLIAATWKLSPSQAIGLFGGIVGVQVYRHPDADGPTKEAADALVTSLNREGIHAEVCIENPANNPKHNRLTMNVGGKQ